MGQNVNYLLGNQSNILGADPETYRQQLIQQEQNRINAMPPQQGYAAQLGTLLGRGMSNLSEGRGAFEVTNPVLQKLTDIQGVYNEALQNSDPADPMSFYSALQKGFTSRNLGQQAMMASVEAKKFEGTEIKTKSDLTDLYIKNPGELENAIQRATDSGNQTKLTELTTLKDKITKKFDLDLAKEQAQINLANAQSANQRAQANKQLEDIASGKYDWKIINDVAGRPVSMAKIDKRTGVTTYEAIPESASAAPSATVAPGAAPAAAKTSGGRPMSEGFKILKVE